MGDLVRLDDYRHLWQEVITVTGVSSTLHVHRNELTEEVEIFQVNDEGEAIRTLLTPACVRLLSAALTPGG